MVSWFHGFLVSWFLICGSLVVGFLVVGFLVSWFYGLLFLGFLFFWFQRFLVSKTLGFLVAKNPLMFLKDRSLGGAQRGNRFASFVRAYARSGCLVELDQIVCGPPFFLFPFGPGELSLFPFGVTNFPFSLAPPPKPPIQL